MYTGSDLSRTNDRRGDAIKLAPFKSQQLVVVIPVVETLAVLTVVVLPAEGTPAVLTVVVYLFSIPHKCNRQLLSVSAANVS